MLTAFLVIVVGFGGGLALYAIAAPRGTEVGEHVTFSAAERVQALVAAAGLLLLGVFLRRVVGLDQDTQVGNVVLGIVGLPVMFLVFIAVMGSVSED